MDEFLALVLHDIESSVEIGAIYNPVLIYKNVSRMKHTRPVGSRVDKARRRRRDHGAHLDRVILVPYVEDPNPGVLVGGKDQFRADEGTRPVLVNVVRTEMSTNGPVIGI